MRSARESFPCNTAARPEAYGRGARSEAESKVESEVEPMVCSLNGRNIGNRLAISGSRDILQGSSHAEIVIAVQEIADVRQSVAAPTSARGASVATVGIVAAGGNGFRIVQISGAASCRDLNAVERLRNVDPPAKRNHEFMIAALNRPQIRDFGVLVVGRAESHLKSGVRLEQPVEAVAVIEPDQRRAAQIIGGGPHRDRGTHSKRKILMVNLGTLILSKSHGHDEAKQKNWAHTA